MKTNGKTGKTAGIGVKVGKMSLGIYFKEFAERVTLGEVAFRDKRNNWDSRLFDRDYTVKAKRKVVKDNPSQTDAHDPIFARNLVKERALIEIDKSIYRAERTIERLQNNIQDIANTIANLTALKVKFEKKFDNFEANNILEAKKMD